MSECLDLVDGLPNGSAYVSAMWPERSWSENRELAVSIRQQVLDAAEALIGAPAEERTRIPRPWDEMLRAAREERESAEAERARRASEYMRNQRWEEV